MLVPNMRTIPLFIALFFWTTIAAAQEPAKVTYDDHVQPIFREKCFACHNQDKASGGLVLTSYGAVMQGGSSGEVVAPGEPGSSYLYSLVTHDSEPYMPPEQEKLPEATLTIIRDWIAGGALENAGSKARKSNKPKVNLALGSAAVGRPEGPPPMPGSLPLEPVVQGLRGNAVTALAASPWAPLVAVGGQHQVLLYHAQSLEPLGVLPFEEGVPHVLKFSRNGQLLLAGGGTGAKSGRVVVWSVATGERLFEVGEEFDTVLAADISADNRLIALGGPSKVVRVYSTEDGSLLAEIKKHTDWIYALEFSPDGVLLATGDRAGGMHVWEADTGRAYLTLLGNTGAVTDISWRIDSNLVASCSEDTTIRVFELENGGQVKGWGAHGGGALSLEYLHDGRLISCGRDRVAKLWDENGGMQRQFPDMPDLALDVAYCQDADRVFAGDWTGEVRAWQGADAAAAGTLSTNPPTLAERVTSSEAALAAAVAQVTAQEPVVQASQQALAAAQEQLAAAQALLAAKQTEHTQTTEALTAATAAVEQSLAARGAKAAEFAAASAALVDAANKCKAAADAATAEPDNAEKAQLAAQAVAETAAITAQVQAAQAAVAQASQDYLAAVAKKTETQTALDALVALLPTLEADVQAKTAAVTAAMEKLNADQQALAPLAAAVEAHKASLAKWQQAIAERK